MIMERPDDAELLAWLDGDLSSERRAEIQQLLETDWELRTALARLERRISKYVEATAHQSAENIEPFDDFWQRLAPQLSSAVVEPPASARLPVPLSLSARLRQKLTRLPLHWRLAGVSALTLLLVAGALFFLSVSSRVRPVSAEELLQRAISGETTRAGRFAEPVIYRRVQVKRLGAESPVTWESWLGARQNQFRQRVATPSGARAVQAQPAAQATAGGEAGVIAELAAIYRENQLDAQRPLSAAAFAEWRGRIRVVRETVTESRESLLLTTSVAEPHAHNAIKEAALLVRKSDWHPIALTLQVQGKAEIRSYELRETAYEVLPAQAVAVFADAPTASLPPLPGAPSPAVAPLPTATTEPLALTPAAPALSASPALEIELLERLNRVNALLGEQLSISSTSAGTLRVEGVVETEERKAELLQTLNAVAAHPAVSLQIRTVAEAAAQQNQSAAAERNLIVQEAQVAQQAIPSETELRNYFSSRHGWTGERLAQEIQQFSSQICGRSSRARAHALALKQVADRFTPAQLQTLDQPTRERWRALLQQHAQAYRREIQQLRQQLQPVFPAAATTLAATGQIVREDELLSAIKRLFELAATNDAALCQSFSISTEVVTAAAVKRADFWRAVGTAENLAAQIATWQ